MSEPHQIHKRVEIEHPGEPLAPSGRNHETYLTDGTRVTAYDGKLYHYECEEYPGRKNRWFRYEEA